MNYYEQLVQRNIGFISPSLQGKISETRVLLAGCGLASVIAVIMTRIGFSHFSFADPDKVEESNLNRQAFDISHLGINKAQALEMIVKKINPSSSVTVTPHAISETDKELLTNNDFIINTVDFDKVYYSLINEGLIRKKYILSPLNVGFGGLLLIFGDGSPSLTEIFNEEVYEDSLFYKKVLTTFKVKIPSYILPNLENLLAKIASTSKSPQIAIGAHISAALTTSAVIKILDGGKVPLAPSVVQLDALETFI